MALIFEKKNHIACLTINRPEAHNALDPETVLELIEAWKEFKEDQEMRCAIITGKGEKAFCTGADLAKLIPLITGAKHPQTKEDMQLQKNPLLTGKALLRDVEIHKPIIAAINGYAIAGGMEILYQTDIRVASEKATFGLQEAKWGIFPMMGSSVRLPRQIPYVKAMELLLTGELMDAQEALRIGFINQVSAPEKVMETAEYYAGMIVKNGPLAITSIKRSVLESMGLPTKEALKKEMEIALPVFMSEDAKEGPRAFKENRPPRFHGK